MDRIYTIQANLGAFDLADVMMVQKDEGMNAAKKKYYQITVYFKNGTKTNMFFKENEKCARDEEYSAIIGAWKNCVNPR